VHALLAVWNAGVVSLNFALSNAPWLFGSGKLGTPCDRIHRAHRTSAAIFGEGPVAGCTPAGSNARQVWLADLYVGLLEFRSLPGPPLIENATPPPAGVVGSGKSETPCERIHREYARNWALVDADLALPEPFEPPQPAARTANPSTAAIAAVHFIAISTWQPFGWVVIAHLYSCMGDRGVTTLTLPAAAWIENQQPRATQLEEANPATACSPIRNSRRRVQASA
jgi:hypothetical protein